MILVPHPPPRYFFNQVWLSNTGGVEERLCVEGELGVNRSVGDDGDWLLSRRKLIFSKMKNQRSPPIFEAERPHHLLM